MTRKTKLTVATLATALSIGGLTAFAMGVAQTGSGASVSALSGDSAKAKIIKIKKVKKVAAGAAQTAAVAGYGGSTLVSSGSSPSVQSPSKGASTVRPPRQSDEDGWDDDGGEEYEDEDHGEDHDDD